MPRAEPSPLSAVRCRKGSQVADTACQALPEPGVQWESVALFAQDHKLLG